MSLATAQTSEMATHVLAVDDNAADRNLLRLSLSDSAYCYSLDCAERLSEGLSKLGRQRTDVILLDLNLPDSQGKDTIRQLMKHASQVPVLILTGSDDDWLALEAVRLGAQDYMVKGQIGSVALSKAMMYAIERHNRLRASQLALRGDSDANDNSVVESASQLHSLPGPSPYAIPSSTSSAAPLADQSGAEKVACIMKSRHGYKGFVIEARVDERKSGGFSAEISIEDHDRAGVREKKFYMTNRFESAASAMESAIQAGRQRIVEGLWVLQRKASN